ncbi:MAG: hypothetical protein Q8781_00245 [Candidatus Phytoplasma stylosanthis]|nr:hypothetical protein [Candidatus Phytoplasma stylosanthis]MDV3167889.1 hypothetical protein [Candidatus Phytoplasma stylosanthis]MDV3170724.1 hypothetical protein [Candidatus Phytoplasma stylosanthis]MDV3173981.1 hypothetical protein [Candidatus Phytoplasma stylosanthis]MDV3202607.1 hypothetical protein [Candidatus Phytoplasma stylosanthis]
MFYKKKLKNECNMILKNENLVKIEYNGENINLEDIKKMLKIQIFMK